MESLIGEELLGARGNDVVGADGVVIGSVEEVYLDPQSGEPKWLALRNVAHGDSLFFVPSAHAKRRVDMVIVAYTHEVIAAAPEPRLDEGGALAPAEEEALLRYYGDALSFAEEEPHELSAVERQMRAITGHPVVPVALRSVPTLGEEETERAVLLYEDVPVLELRFLRRGSVRLVEAGEIPRSGAHLRREPGLERRTS